MQISIGLTNTALTSLEHSFLLVRTNSSILLEQIAVTQLLEKLEQGTLLVKLEPRMQSAAPPVQASPSVSLRFSAKNNSLFISGDYSGHVNVGQAILIRGTQSAAKFSVLNISRQHAKNSSAPVYQGALQIFAQGNIVRCSLICDLEKLCPRSVAV